MTVSVPYRGATFLNCMPQFKKHPQPLYGFRPLSGSYISQLNNAYGIETLNGGFRPLSGSYISQSEETK